MCTVFFTEVFFQNKICQTMALTKLWRFCVDLNTFMTKPNYDFVKNEFVQASDAHNIREYDFIYIYSSFFLGLNTNSIWWYKSVGIEKRNMKETIKSFSQHKASIWCVSTMQFPAKVSLSEYFAQIWAFFFLNKKTTSLLRHQLRPLRKDAAETPSLRLREAKQVL